jgi:hypothetical protein
MAFKKLTNASGISILSMGSVFIRDLIKSMAIKGV